MNFAQADHLKVSSCMRLMEAEIPPALKGFLQESISPTFYERNCANFLAQVKNLTFTSSTKKA